MEIEIKFWGQRNQELTKAEADLLGDYAKVWIKDGVLWKREDFMRGVSICSSRYLLEGESEPEIVANESEDFPENSVIIVEKTVFDNGEYLERCKSYVDGVLYSRRNLLFDQFHRYICEEVIDMDTNLPDYKKTEKFFYLNDQDSLSAIDSEYNTDGSLNHIYYDPDGWSERFLFMNVYDWESEFFPDTDLSYYATAQIER